MARKEDKALIDDIDYAIDCMNVETPNWRTELYIKYYGSVENNLELTENEQAYLSSLRESSEPVRAVMDPDADPYSWYENGEAHGIAADIFRAAADELGLNYEIVPVSDKEEYLELIASGGVDIWLDMSSGNDDENGNRYKRTAASYDTALCAVRKEQAKAGKNIGRACGGTGKGRESYGSKAELLLKNEP